MSNSREEQIRAAFEEYVEKGNVEIMEEIIAEDYIVHAGRKEISGRTPIKESAGQFRAAFPDLHVAEIKFLVQDGDTIVWQRTLEGTHETEWQGIPPSGKKVTWVEMVVTLFKKEKIAEEWIASEFMGELLSSAS